jgi:hypothetical protein
MPLVAGVFQRDGDPPDQPRRERVVRQVEGRGYVEGDGRGRLGVDRLFSGRRSQPRQAANLDRYARCKLAIANQTI